MGSDVYVKKMPYPLVELPETGVMSFFAWVKRDDATNLDTVIAKDESIGSQAYVFAITAVGKLELKMGGDEMLIESVGTMTDTDWHHIGFTKTTRNAALYVDGEVVFTRKVGIILDNALDIQIGRRYLDSEIPTYTEYFDGLMDESKIYDRALSATDVRALYNSELYNIINTNTIIATTVTADNLIYLRDERISGQGLVGYWSANGHALDYSGTGNDGTAAGGVPYATGKMGQAFDFDGTNGRIDVGDQTTLEPTDLTLTFWAKTTAFGDSLNGGIAKGDIFGTGGDFSYRLDFHLGNARGHITNAANSTVGGQISIGDNNWYMWTLTRDDTNVKLYKDGVLGVTETTDDIDYTKTVNNFVIGAQDDGSFSFDGLIDEVSVYDRALSVDEIRSLYETQREMVVQDAYVRLIGEKAGIGTEVPVSLFEVDGPVGTAIETVTGNTTLDNTHSTLLVNASGNVTITLPSAASSYNNTDGIGRIYRIKKIDADADIVTIDGANSEEIDGETTQVLITQFQSLTIQSGGSGWHIL